MRSSLVMGRMRLSIPSERRRIICQKRGKDCAYPRKCENEAPASLRPGIRAAVPRVIYGNRDRSERREGARGKYGGKNARESFIAAGGNGGAN